MHQHEFNQQINSLIARVKVAYRFMDAVGGREELELLALSARAVFYWMSHFWDKSIVKQKEAVLVECGINIEKKALYLKLNELGDIEQGFLISRINDAAKYYLEVLRVAEEIQRGSKNNGTVS